MSNLRDLAALPATATGSTPPAKLFSPGWIYELKYDGFRCLIMESGVVDGLCDGRLGQGSAHKVPHGRRRFTKEADIAAEHSISGLQSRAPRASSIVRDLSKPIRTRDRSSRPCWTNGRIAMACNASSLPPAGQPRTPSSKASMGAFEMSARTTTGSKPERRACGDRDLASRLQRAATSQRSRLPTPVEFAALPRRNDRPTRPTRRVQPLRTRLPAS